MKLYIYATPIGVNTGWTSYSGFTDKNKATFDTASDYFFLKTIDVEMSESDIEKALTPGVVENLKKKQANLRTEIALIDDEINSLLAIEHVPEVA